MEDSAARAPAALRRLGMLLLLPTPMRLLTLLICAVPMVAAAAPDPHSYANLDQVKPTHLRLDLHADFDARELRGFAEYSLQAVGPDLPPTLVVDTRALDIGEVLLRNADGRWRKTRATLAAADPRFGAALSIALKPDTVAVRIHYATSPAASGVQWLPAELTAGKRGPFLFTQSQAIHARSWIPIADSPMVRLTYDARIRTPATLRALMSAQNDPDAPRNGDYRFVMREPIPPYLMALAIGDVEFKPISDRVGVYAEAELLDAAAAEFSETESMVQAAEALYGPYRWGRYDLLILPPSFPFGGMENPRLSFITPTVIAGDRSLTALIAHELAHSWSGNLVTNARWEDFWLNEGFTTYFEGRIVEAVYGVERYEMELVINLADLAKDLRDLPPADTRLVPPLTGRDPDEAFSRVPYVKGQFLLKLIEQRVGRPAFDAFLRAYFDRYAFGTITTTQFLADLEAELIAKQPDRLSLAEIKAWIEQPGMPANAPEVISRRFAAAGEAAQRFVDNGTMPTAEGWTPFEWLHFFSRLPQPLSTAQLAELDLSHKLSTSSNSEIAHAWYLLAIAGGYQPARSPMADYMTRIGRRKLIVPLYQALVERGGDDAAYAREIYARARPGYHPITQHTLDAVFGESAP